MARNKYPEETIKLILEVSLKLFMQKGYDNTSIQDIINHLGGLSKGAIYHHFKSKEEIFVAVCEKIGLENSAYYAKIRDDKSKNGYEKLKCMLNSAYSNPTNDAMIAMIKQTMRDPRFFMNQVNEIFEVVAPQFITPILVEGIKDGSINTPYPEELAEMIIILLNLWINPVVAESASKNVRNKMLLFRDLLRGIGIDLLDDENIEQYVTYCSRFLSAK